MMGKCVIEVVTGSPHSFIAALTPSTEVEGRFHLVNSGDGGQPVSKSTVAIKAGKVMM
ncbi:hypothetical protein PLUA15_190077 [Pseudomonas lundensis]|uniref:Uncharacterized protein n=1 Tax=Pseudomonas lundensis TaxID=86185 RepID=A0AAX2H5D5_9PSED|nr:hypothetical protein PLUA15_190077 [Pseudomonas lundensis]